VTPSVTHESNRQAIGPVDLEVFSGGRGPSLVLLHDHEYVNGWYPFMEALSRDFHVVAPTHPGFGGSSLPADFESVDDLVYVYLDLLRTLGGAPVHLVGLGLGGWVAAEMTVRCEHDLASLTLVDAVGIKVGDHLTRDIVDTFVIAPQEFLNLAWHDPEAGEATMRLAGLGEPTEEELTSILRGRQTAALLTWKPFMHNPRLRGRLRRITIPTLVLWGESDNVVTTAYGRAFAASVPGARFVSIPAAGHYPYLERPDAFADALRAFLRDNDVVAREPRTRMTVTGLEAAHA
jgi:pimeloyl-ACP methyl ester carboxylesterase